MNAFPVLESDRLRLRQFTAADQALVFKGLSDPEVIKYYGISFDTFEATAEQMEWFANLEKTKTGLWWAVCLAKDGTFLGAGGLNEWNAVHRKAEIGFWLLPTNWGHGYMSEAMPLITQYAFDHLDIHRIEGFVDAENKACKKAMDKLGYTLEGTMRDCEVKDRRTISLDIYAKLSTDGNA